MHLTRVIVSNVRNLVQIAIEPTSGFNLLIGENGAGKTSFLEALYILGLGRSFRSHLTSHIIHHTADKLTIFAEIDNQEGQLIPMGMEKSNSATTIKMSGRTVNTIAEVAGQLPLQLINVDTHKLISEGPKHRRQFVDWGMFHVKHSFFSVWQEFQKTLRQRNAMLRQSNCSKLIQVWDEAFVTTALKLESMRKEYVELFTPFFIELLGEIMPMGHVTLTYQQGWNQTKELAQVLKDSLSHDIALGHTQSGPQRSDLLITVDGEPARHVLSRGQQKSMLFALKLAQGIMLRRLNNKICIYLIDDIASELDEEHRQRLLNVLRDLQAQVFLTAINDDILTQIKGVPIKMFHVKHGAVVAVK